MDEISGSSSGRLAQLQANYSRVREIIRSEEMWERVPDWARDFSPENLEGLVKFAYFGGFITMAAVRLFLRREVGQSDIPADLDQARIDVRYKLPGRSSSGGFCGDPRGPGACSMN